MQPELPDHSSRAGGDRGALLRLPFKGRLFAFFCDSFEASLEVGDFEPDQSAECLARSEPGGNSYLAGAAGRSVLMRS